MFDVDIEDGKPALKLPFNVNQNPYEAATKFLENNKLPMTYLDAVASHIVANSQGATLGETAEAPSTAGSDPWGSDQRYRPGGDQTPAPPRPQPKTLPVKAHQTIMVSSLPKLQAKIKELNQVHVSDGFKEDVTLSLAELSTLEKLRQSLELKSPKPVAGGLDLVIKLSTAWPYKDRMPGLDALRLITPFSETAKYTESNGANIVDVILSGAAENSPPAENHIMMAIRAFANLFGSPEGRSLAKAEFEKIQTFVKSSIQSSTNRNLMVAAATLYVNYAILFYTDSSAGVGPISEVLESVTGILRSQTDSEVVFRALAALGTAGMTDGIKELCDGYDVEGAITEASNKVKEPRIRNLVAEIKAYLK